MLYQPHFFLITLFSPIWILALINRGFFGRVICVISQDGIRYEGIRVGFEKIKEARYELFEGVRLIGDETDILIRGAPLLMLRKLIKQNENLKIALSKVSILAPVITIFAIIMLAFLITLIY